MMKFKVGDYVEVTKSMHGNKGHRFVIERIGNVRMDGRYVENAVMTDISSGGKSALSWCEQNQLKLVHDDEAGDMSFDELMLDLTQKLTVK